MKEIPLTQGKVALVDDSDYERLIQWKWCVVKADRNFYAAHSIRISRKKTQMLFMHRVILNAKRGDVTDHRDGNGLNNTRENIRLGTQLANMRSFRRKAAGKSSRFRGVHWSNTRNVWIASVVFTVKGKPIQKYRRQFHSEEEAARAFNRAATALGYEIQALNKVA